MVTHWNWHQHVLNSAKIKGKAFSNTSGKQGDSMFYIRANKTAGKGAGTVIGTDGKQILIKNGSFYVRVHSCNMQLEDSFSNNTSAQLVYLDPESETLSPSKFPENLADMNYDGHSMFMKVQISTQQRMLNSVENQVSSQNTGHNLQNSDINEQALKYTSKEKPNIKQCVKYKETDSNDIVDVHISTGGKASTKNNNCII